MKIPQIIIDELISQARQDAPNETCGYLLGISGDEGDEVTENYWMENIDHSPEHFSFAPKDQFADSFCGTLLITSAYHHFPATQAEMFCYSKSDALVGTCH